MKVENKRLSIMSIAIAMTLASGSMAAHAQDLLNETDDLLQDGSALQMDDIQIDGKLSPSDLLRKRREKLEERNKLMVEKKIEDIRVKQEIALTNKLQGAFEKGMNNINEDKVQVAQAAPVAPQPVVQPAVQPVVQPIIIETKYEPKEEVKAEKTSKLLPYIGFQAIKGTNIDFESKVNVGATFETKVNSNFTVGLGLGYTSLDATDNANKFVSTNNTYYYYSGTYSSYYPNGRTVNYSKVALSANGKYFLTVDSKFRPYVGAGVDFNRANLSYDSSSNVYINGLTFGGEETSSNYVTALAKIGTEFDLNETVGFNIDFSYSTSFASSNSQTNSAQSSTNPDQNRLENMAQAMSTSNVTAISGGIVVKF